MDVTQPGDTSVSDFNSCRHYSRSAACEVAVCNLTAAVVEVGAASFWFLTLLLVVQLISHSSACFCGRPWKDFYVCYFGHCSSLEGNKAATSKSCKAGFVWSEEVCRKATYSINDYVSPLGLRHNGGVLMRQHIMHCRQLYENDCMGQKCACPSSQKFSQQKKE